MKDFCSSSSFQRVKPSIWLFLPHQQPQIIHALAFTKSYFLFPFFVSAFLFSSIAKFRIISMHWQTFWVVQILRFLWKCNLKIESQLYSENALRLLFTSKIFSYLFCVILPLDKVLQGWTTKITYLSRELSVAVVNDAKNNKKKR